MLIFIVFSLFPVFAFSWAWDYGDKCLKERCYWSQRLCWKILVSGRLFFFFFICAILIAIDVVLLQFLTSSWKVASGWITSWEALVWKTHWYIEWSVKAHSLFHRKACPSEKDYRDGWVLCKECQKGVFPFLFFITDNRSSFVFLRRKLRVQGSCSLMGYWWCAGSLAYRATWPSTKC